MQASQRVWLLLERSGGPLSCRGHSGLLLKCQDKFDHDKGQKSAISGRRLHWRLSTGFFCFFSSIYVQFSKTRPTKSGESSEKSSGENRVKSCHVCGCHGFFGPENGEFRFRPQSPIKEEKGTQTQTFWSRYFSVGVGVFHVNGWGPKSSICPSKPGKSNFFGGISRDFAGISRRCWKVWEKSLCLIVVPYPNRKNIFSAQTVGFPHRRFQIPERTPKREPFVTISLPAYRSHSGPSGPKSQKVEKVHGASWPRGQKRLKKVAKRHIKLREILGTPAGCPWDTRRDKQGSTGRCPGDFLFFTKKWLKKGLFARTQAGCLGDTRPSRAFSEFYVIFSYVPFLLPSDFRFEAQSPNRKNIFLCKRSGFCRFQIPERTPKRGLLGALFAPKIQQCAY